MLAMITVVTLDPGILNGSAERAFTYGACGGLAIVLHDRTGWPLVMVTDAESAYAPDGQDLADAGPAQRARTSNQAGMGASGMHWLVLHPSGQLADADGLRSPSDVLEQYEGEGSDSCEGRVALALASRAHAVEEYVAQKGEPVPLPLAETFADPVLKRAEAGLLSSPQAARRQRRN